MINGLEGIPGSGKSYEAVAHHVLPALRAGRKVITNLPLDVERFAAIDPAFRDLIEVRTMPAPVRGVWGASDAATEPAFRLSGEPRPAGEDVAVFGHVWDYWTDWRADDGRGPLFVIDECHVPLPTIGTSKEVIEWFKLHRHFNVDVLLLTQSFRDTAQPIARLLGMLIRCRKADVLGKADHYIRKVHGGYRGAEIQREQRKYRPEFFSLYRSHTQGVSVGEGGALDVAPMIVKFQRWTWVVLVLGLVLTVWAFWPKDGRNIWGGKTSASPSPSGARWVTPAQYSAGRASAPMHTVAAAPVEPASASVEPAVDLLPGKLVHIVGVLSMGGKTRTLFTVSQGGRRIFDTDNEQLAAAGFKWRGMGDCFGWLDYEKRSLPVTCDAPVMASGTSERPIVFDSGSGRRSDARAPRSEPMDAPARVERSGVVTAADVAAAYAVPGGRVEPKPW